MGEFIDFGALINELRLKNNLSQKVVADKLGIDVSMLSKIEHGERQIQQRMLPILSNLFNLDFKELQIKYLTTKMESEFGREPFFKESLERYLSTAK
ncbi:MAG: helix-turn-helix transcriptional regulator [Bacteroidia bacterium]